MKLSLRAHGTLKDVAKVVGVSHTAVSNAFYRPNQLSTKLRESFLAAARSINYSDPNSAARMLRIGFAKTIAVVWTDPMAHAFENQAGGVLLSGVADACAERSLDLLLLQGGAASAAVRG
jgi:DNA-binding LacI/PurR family transcriptional regulator